MPEVPHLNLLSKIDLIKNQISKSELNRFLNPESTLLNGQVDSTTNPSFHELNKSLVRLIEDFSIVQFLPLKSSSSRSLKTTLSNIDDITQWAEDQEPKEPKDLNHELSEGQ